ncbi:MFS transporter [Streptomyces erythrochromogenes]|uniref:MFS transporter n=1 Tax=Streptomyces erythrochromogenes TaxID=285574 RepID=UPI0036FB32B5
MRRPGPRGRVVSAAPSATAARGAWSNTRLLLLFMVVNFADKAVLGLAGPDIMRDLGLGREEFGTAQSAFFALFSLSAVGVSLLTRRVRTTVLLLAMALLWSVAQLPMLWTAAGFGTLVATRVLLGAAEGPSAPVAVHHLYGWFPQRDRTLPTAVLMVGAAAGVAVAAPVLSAVIAWWGWRWSFGLVGLAGIGWAAVWVRRGGQGPLAPALPGRDAEAATKAAAVTEAADTAGPALRRILRSPTVLAAVLGCFAAYWHMSSQLTWVPDYLRTDLGWNGTLAGAAVAAGALANGAALLGHGLWERRSARRTDHVPRLPSGAGAGLLMLVAAGAVAVFAVAEPLWARLPMLVGPMALSAVMMTVAQTACGRIVPAGRRGPVLGLVVGVASLGGVLSPVLLGRVIDAAPTAAAGYERAWLLTAALLAVSGACAAVFLRPERDARRLGVAADTAPAPGVHVA